MYPSHRFPARLLARRSRFPARASSLRARLACTVGLALTALGAVASGAAGGSAANGNKLLTCSERAQACMTAPEYRALMVRSEAVNREYFLGAD